MSFYSSDPVRFNSVSMVTATLGPNDGEVGHAFRDGDEEYVLVYNNGNSQISPGFGCIVSGVSGYSVTVSSTTSVDLLIGVVKHATLTTATYGYVVCRGWSQVQMDANNSCAAGQILTLAQDGRFALKSNSTGYPSPAFAKSMEAMASGASGTAYIAVF